MFRDQFKTISGYHFYLKRIEKEMYNPSQFWLDPDLVVDNPDEYGLFYPAYQGWLDQTHTSRPMFEINDDHSRSADDCFMCSPLSFKIFWEDMHWHWQEESSEYEVAYDPDLAATAGHP